MGGNVTVYTYDRVRCDFKFLSTRVSLLPTLCGMWERAWLPKLFLSFNVIINLFVRTRSLSLFVLKCWSDSVRFTRVFRSTVWNISDGFCICVVNVLKCALKELSAERRRRLRKSIRHRRSNVKVINYLFVILFAKYCGSNILYLLLLEIFYIYIITHYYFRQLNFY